MLMTGKREFRQSGHRRSSSDGLSFELRPAMVLSTQQGKEDNPCRGFSSCKSPEVVTSLEGSKEQILLLCDYKKVEEGRSSRK